AGEELREVRERLLRRVLSGLGDGGSDRIVTLLLLRREVTLHVLDQLPRLVGVELGRVVTPRGLRVVVLLLGLAGALAAFVVGHEADADDVEPGGAGLCETVDAASRVGRAVGDLHDGAASSRSCRDR